MAETTTGRNATRKKPVRKATARKKAATKGGAAARQETGGGGVDDGDLVAAAASALQALTVRGDVLGRLGKSYGDNRDLYEALGWPLVPTDNDLWGHYRRNSVAKAVVDAPVRACWRKVPTISEAETDDTDGTFDTRIRELVEELRLFHYFSRVDRLARLGEYAVLLVGFDDNRPLSEPCESASDVLWLAPYRSVDAAIKTDETDPTNRRYGQPLTYSITPRVTGRTENVHWTRVIHVAEDVLGSDVKGVSTLLAIFNLLMDLEKVVGGAAEMFWRAAHPGIAFITREGAAMSTTDKSDFEEMLKDYAHKLTRFLRMKGIDPKVLESQVADPSNIVDVMLTLISATTRIPKRILLGSERGELASSQDEKNWANAVDERRREHCEPTIIRQFIDRLSSVGALDVPEKGYDVEWPDLLVPSAKDKAEVGKLIAEALKTYTEAPGADLIMPARVFQRDAMGLDQAVIEEIEETVGAALDEEERDRDEAEKVGTSEEGADDWGEEDE